uniref:Macrophage colony-stimulating factor 1 n=1 Tax=Pelusios castaneus TaxID=367368 RepID=A0A8C8RFV2_9SAUR
MPLPGAHACGPKACPFPCALLTFLLLAICHIHETEQKGYCENIITQKHLDKLQELIDSQMLVSCHLSFEFIDEKQLDDPTCFVKAAFPELENLLEKMKFKQDSDNFNKTKDIENMYRKIDENEVPCIDDQDDHERELSQACFKEFSMPPEKMLELVKNFFYEVKGLLDANKDFKRDCSTIYQMCSDSLEKEPSSQGVVTDRDFNSPSPSPLEGPPASPHPALATKPLLSTVVHLGSKDTAASAHPSHRQLGAGQTPARLHTNAMLRAPRSTHRGLGATEIQEVWAGVSASVSSPPAELEVPTASQGPGTGSVSTELLPGLTESPRHEPSSTNDIAASPLSLLVSGGEMLQKEEIEPRGTEAERIQAWPTGPKEFLHTPGSPDPSHSMKPTSPRTVEDATRATWTSSAAELSTHLGDPDTAETISRPALASMAVDVSGAYPGGRLVTPLPRELWPSPSLGSNEPISVVQRRFSRMAAITHSLPVPESPNPQHPAPQGKAPDIQHTMGLRGKRGEGLPRFREPDNILAGPIPDLNVLPSNTDQRWKETQPKESSQAVMIYVLVAVLAILLAVGGLLFYKHRCRTLERRQQRRENDLEEQEGRPLNGVGEHLELQAQAEL